MLAITCLFIPTGVFAATNAASTTFVLDHAAPLLTFNYSTTAPAAKNWIGLYKYSAGPENNQTVNSLTWDWAPASEGSVQLSVKGISAGTYTAYLLANNGYALMAEPIDLHFNGLGSIEFAVTNFTTHNARQGDSFRAKIGGLVSKSPNSGVKFSKVTSKDGDWATVSSDGSITGIPTSSGVTQIQVEAVGGDGSKAQLEVIVPVRPKASTLVENLTVLSYNLWHGGAWVNDYHDKQIRFLTSVGADIVGVQESQRGNVNRLASALGWYQLSYSDVGIISRYPIVETGNQTSRGCSVHISLEGRQTDLIMWTTHLGYLDYGPYDFCFYNKTKEETLQDEVKSGRKPQIIEITSAMKAELANSAKVPVLLTGDFNAPSQLDYTNETAKLHCNAGEFLWPSSQYPIEAGLIDSYRNLHKDPLKDPGVTWSPVQKTTTETGFEGKPEPMDRVDFVYYKGSLKVLSSETVVVGTPKFEPNYKDNEWTSDHAAVKTVFKVTTTE